MAHALYGSYGTPASLHTRTAHRLAYENPRVEENTREEHRSFPPTAAYPPRPASRLRGPIATHIRLADSISPPKHPESNQVTESLLPGGATDYTDPDGFFARLEDEQEDLRDARERLLGSRVRLQQQRRELLKTRDRTSSQAVLVFDRIRLLLVGIGVEIPEDIESALSELEILRNKLGVEEFDYDGAEKAYNVDEWAYTKKESGFMQDLCRGAPTRPQQVNLLPPNDYPEVSTRFSYGAQDIENLVAESEGDIALESYERNMTLPDDDDISDGQNTYRQLSEPGTQGTDPTTHTTATEAVKMFLSDRFAHGRERRRWVGTQRSVDEWLLNALKVSHFEQARLQEWLSLYTDNDDWWDYVDGNWFAETSDISKYHTGDTTIPDEDLSNPTVANELRNVDEASDTSETREQQFSAVPLLAQDRVVDAMESVNFPSTIEPQDLNETWSRDTKIKSTPTSSKYQGSVCSHVQSEEVNATAQQELELPAGKLNIADQDQGLETTVYKVADDTESTHCSPVGIPQNHDLRSVKLHSSDDVAQATDGPSLLTDVEVQAPTIDSIEEEPRADL